ncbi:MAG: DUF1272 domain-containing protein [Pseudomonadota bacterium]
MLLLKPNCECCDKDLPPEANDALICTFECTFCAECIETHFDGHCPNCGGNMVPRPIRPADKLRNNPASIVRVIKAHAACAEA